jgi:hypothetical protein
LDRQDAGWWLAPPTVLTAPRDRGISHQGLLAGVVVGGAGAAVDVVGADGTVLGGQ